MLLEWITTVLLKPQGHVVKVSMLPLASKLVDITIIIFTQRSMAGLRHKVEIIFQIDLQGDIFFLKRQVENKWFIDILFHDVKHSVVSSIVILFSYLILW